MGNRKTLSRLKKEGILLLFLLCGVSFSHASAQEIRTEKDAIAESDTARFSWKEFFGFSVEASATYLGLTLHPSALFPEGGYVDPMFGGRVQLGLVMDKQDISPMTLILGYSKIHNYNRKSQDLISGASLLNIGMEYPSWIYYSRDKNKFSYDIGVYAARCQVYLTDGSSSHQWGIMARHAVCYQRKSDRGDYFGIRLYMNIGYFWKRKASQKLPFYSMDDLGIAAFFAF